ncbi:hypothetical protein HanHA300_Chr00c0053g0699931 [Helianthus annuus]|nr:hypothetical protein HanHA89_Chr02g0042881 [Helianthus annuus]KAJ0638719.1 hypothetical protein HanHA300_Chr00c0053g0699931 [Helianthus annuus]KAJ0776072.1 hypothetical protein HanLR1_Chr02g0041441 [Helianthus annuus]
MENPNENNSNCELASEILMKSTQIADTIFDIERLEEDMMEFTLEQPTIIIDETSESA